MAKQAGTGFEQKILLVHGDTETRRSRRCFMVLAVAGSGMVIEGRTTPGLVVMVQESSTSAPEASKRKGKMPSPLRVIRPSIGQKEPGPMVQGAAPVERCS